MKKILFTLFTLIMFTHVFAYENKFFKVELPDSYKQTVNETNMFKWVKDNNYLAITISDNTKLKYNVVEFKDEDLVTQKEYLEKGINDGLKKYEITAEVSNINKVTKNNTTYLEYDVFYPSKEITGYDTYQKGRMYTTNKYITTVIFNSDKEIKEDNQEYQNIMNSLTILDSNIVIKTITIKDYIIAIVSVGIIAGIIGAIISQKKKYK